MEVAKQQRRVPLSKQPGKSEGKMKQNTCTVQSMYISEKMKNGGCGKEKMT